MPLDNPEAEPQTAVGPNAGLVLRYGNWSDTLGPGCYQEDSVWRPGPAPPTVYIAVRFANTSAASYREALDSTVPVLLNVHSDKTFAPVPGGCSTTGQTENDPTLALDFDDESTSVAFQQGDVGLPRYFHGAMPHGCSCDFIQVNEQSEGGTLTYEVYRSFIADCGSKLHGAQQDHASLYTLLKRMSTVNGVKQYGTKHPEDALLPSYTKRVELDSVPGQVRPAAWRPKSRQHPFSTPVPPILLGTQRVIALRCGVLPRTVISFGLTAILPSSIPTQGVVYNVLVTDTFRHQQNPSDPIEKYQSIYTPHHTYACTSHNEPGKENCSNLSESPCVSLPYFSV